jgi:hypothetical protein
MMETAFGKDATGKYPGMLVLCFIGSVSGGLMMFQAKMHAQKVAKKLEAPSGLIFLPGQEETSYEDSDMGPEFHQRRYFSTSLAPVSPGALSRTTSPGTI